MATQTPLQPKDKTDSKWLRDAGYPGGMPQFMTSFGLQFPDEIDKAKELINGFRNDDQEKWETSNTNTSNEPSQVSKSDLSWFDLTVFDNYSRLRAIFQNCKCEDNDTWLVETRRGNRSMD